MIERKEIESLFDKLENSKTHVFPETGKVDVSVERGVYIIYQSNGNVLHVGRTPSGKKGLNQRLYNHLTGSSSLYKNYLRPNKISLRNGYIFRYIEVKDARQRTLLESLAIGKLCPVHLGISEKRKE